MGTIIALLLGASWKTSLIGWAGAVVNLVLTQMATGHVDWKTLAASAFALLLGRASKDANVSNAPNPVASRAITTE